jgi:integrase
MIRKVNRRGKRTLVVDIVRRKADGSQGRYRKDATVQTMAAATAEERRLLANLATYGDVFELSAPKEEQPKPTSITFGEAVESFRKGRAVTELKPSTWKGYEEILTTQLLPVLKERPLEGVGFSDASSLDAQLVKSGASPSRRRNVQIVLRSVLSASHEAGQLAEMPKLPTLPKVGRKVLTASKPEQLKAILDASPTAWKLAFTLAAYAGLRAGEVRALRWSDVDLIARVLVVGLATSRGVTSTPKSGHEREIPLAEPLFLLLQGGGKGLVARMSAGEQWGDFGLLQAFQRAQKND